MANNNYRTPLSYLCTLFCLMFFTAIAQSDQATLCAKVKIEITQELAFERQAFDARMVITNGLTEFSLDEVNIDVIFKDETGNLVTATSNPSDLSALFFITVSSMSGINDISGSGTIAPQSAAEVHWLIIPASGAAAGFSLGKLYFVGAFLSYKTNGDLSEVDIAPDFITVLPTAELVLDYFLPSDVYADDPLTTAVELPQPFTLGVRITNQGLGSANKATITSSQPKIVENQQGLLISFQIISSFVDDQPAAPTLQLNFGDINPGISRAGRWQMQTSLSGKFVSFAAEFSHADELGGELTSLLKEVNTHFLLKDVIVDLPGHDKVKDFLVRDQLLHRLYESEGGDVVVADQSQFVALKFISSSAGIDTYEAIVPPTAGPLYFSVSDPYNGTKAILEASRSDGKTLPLTNVWFAAEGTGASKQYFFRLFDSNSGGKYTLKVGAPPSSDNHPPIIRELEDYRVYEGRKVTFVVQSWDPDGTIPLLSIDSLPNGASFTLLSNNLGRFSWITKLGQAGEYPLTFRATDGISEAIESNTVHVYGLSQPASLLSGSNTSGNSHRRNRPSKKKPAGSSSHPKHPIPPPPLKAKQSVQVSARLLPFRPRASSPRHGALIDAESVNLIADKLGLNPRNAKYHFELAESLNFSKPMFSADAHSEPKLEGRGEQALVALESALAPNQQYYWRVRSEVDGIYSEWDYATFTATDPTQFDPLFSSAIQDQVEKSKYTNQVKTKFKFRKNQATLRIKTPMNSTDLDLNFLYELSPDPSFNSISHSNIVTKRAKAAWLNIQLPPLDENKQYYVRIIPSDNSGNPNEIITSQTQDWTYGNFIYSKINEHPSKPSILNSLSMTRVESVNPTLRVARAVDPEQDLVRYEFEIYSDKELTRLHDKAITRSAKWRPSIKLSDKSWYYWRVRATDRHGLSSKWSDPQLFLVVASKISNGVN